MSRHLPVVMLLFAGLSLAAGAGEPETGEELILNEVVVKGTRSWKLREQMVQVEEKFYALYNELNPDKDFDVHCHIEAPTGRIIKERICRVALNEDAQAVEVKALLDGHNAPPAAMVAQAREAQFEENFLRVVNSDPRLLKLVREREALAEEYDAEHKRQLAGRRWFQFRR